MAYAFSLPQQCKIVEGFGPAADAGGRTSDYVSLKNYHKAYIVVHITQGAANTILLSPLQASAVAPTGSKVLANAVPIWTNIDNGAADALAKQTDAVNFTTDAGTPKNKYVIFEIDPAKLDVAGGFDCIALSTGASAAANITECTFYLVPGRYNEAVIPSAIID